MPVFQYQSVLLHALPDNQGWQIIGIKHNRQQELIAYIAPVTEEWLVKHWADQAALNLAGKPGANID